MTRRLFSAAVATGAVAGSLFLYRQRRSHRRGRLSLPLTHPRTSRNRKSGLQFLTPMTLEQWADLAVRESMLNAAWARSFPGTLRPSSGRLPSGTG